MRTVVCLGLLAGCEQVFPLDGPQVCSGNSPIALLDHCAEPTSETFSLEASIDTGVIGGALGDCDEIFVQHDVDGTELCVIAATTIAINTTQVIGERPLALFAIEDLEVTGLLSAASRPDQATGGGANFGGCASDVAGTNAVGEGGGGGGAGGTFQTLGGNGGHGGAGLGTGNAAGGMAKFAGVPGFVRGGCPGGNGGSAVGPGTGGFGGRSGGALYLVAGNTIVISGTIDVAGEGGRGGLAGITGGGGGGGGGGGSGGLIGLDAPLITLTVDAQLVANGGGGGAGGGDAPNEDGGDGGTPNLDSYPFSAPGGVTLFAGAGGAGEDAENAIAGNGASQDNGNPAGGGGGAGLGFIVIAGALDDQDADTSPDYDN